jgi:hypothetical protein
MSETGQGLDTIGFNLNAPVSIRVATLQVFYSGQHKNLETLHIDDRMDAAEYFLERLTNLAARHQ